MSDIEIRDDRAAGRLEALGEGGEVVGRIEYFVLESPAPALVPVHTIVGRPTRARASPGRWRGSSTPPPGARASPWRRSARTS